MPIQSLAQQVQVHTLITLNLHSFRKEFCIAPSALHIRRCLLGAWPSPTILPTLSNLSGSWALGSVV